MNTLPECPICSATEHDHFMTAKDLNFTKEEFNIVQCQSCSFRFTNPIPTEDKIGDYYKADNYISHTSSKKGLFERLYHMVRSRAIKKKYRLVAKHSKGKNHLDIGCGTGDFLAYIKSQNWSTKGLEPSESARQMAIENHGLDVESIEELPNQTSEQFDSISMWHVLEHVYNLNSDFAQYKRVLKPDGTLIIAVPNCSSYDAKYYKENWAAYDLPIHLYHFQPKDIKALASKFNMKVVEVLPMKFDSFYVSMLSEKYKAGKEKLSLGLMIKGFFKGLKSNSKATNETYSSQIYVLKHQ